MYDEKGYHETDTMKINFPIFIVLAILIFPEFCRSAPSCPDLNIQVKDHLVSINVKEKPLKCILDQISQKTGIDIKLWQDIEKPMTMMYAQVTLEDFFSRIGAANALVYTYLPEQKTYRMIAVNMAQSHAAVLKKATDTKKPILPKPRINDNARPGELLIRFKDSVSRDQMEHLHRFLGSTVLKQIDGLNLHRIRLDPQLTREKATQMYLATGLVKTAEPNFLRTVQTVIPNDPRFDDQWGLGAISAPDAWEITQGSHDVIIAVIDTGVDFHHPDLAQNIWINEKEANGLDGVDDDGNGYTDDIYGWDFADTDNLPFDLASRHGTHVAGIIGAVTNNSTGIAGVCPKVKLMVLKVQKNGEDTMETMAIVEAIVYARKMGAHIINCSFGGGDSSTNEYDEFEQFQTANNGLIVCAAGNGGADTDNAPLYPAGYDLPGIISVASSTKTATGEYILSGFSNFGATSVDVLAPGDDIYSTIPGTRMADAHLTIGSDPAPYPAVEMEFAGTTDENGITGNLVDCGYGYADDIPVSVKNNIALIQRGDLYFHQKVTNVQEKGAIGAIIYNNEDPTDNTLNWTLLTPGDWIPVISVAHETGLVLRTHNLTPVTLVNQMIEDVAAYGNISGTSMAAGFVTGATGLLRTRVPEEPFIHLKQILLQTVDIIDSTQGKLVTNGQINILKALLAMNLPGDVNKDFKLRLEDTIQGLKTLSGSSSEAVSPDISHWDANHNDHLELIESIHVLQKKAH